MINPWESEQWHISHLNFQPEVRAALQYPDQVILSDKGHAMQNLSKKRRKLKKKSMSLR